MEMLLQLLLVILFLLQKVYSFNLSPVPNIIIKEPPNSLSGSKNKSSYFGYSILLRETSVIIAAPRGLTQDEQNADIIESGVIYKYRFANNTIAAFIFANTLNKAKYVDIKNQWLGASMDGGSKETDKFIVCAPRISKNPENTTLQYMRGVCYWSRNSLEMKLNNYIIYPLAASNMQVYINSYNESAYLYMLAELGISAHITPNNMEFIIGAPGIYNWGGAAIQFSTKTKTSRVKDLQSMDFSYGGYAVSSGYLNSSNPADILYLMTLPHGNNVTQLGQAIIFSFFHTKAPIKILEGQQFGELFGYAALVVDVNGDGLDDILISAPRHSVSERFDVGLVYAFVNKGDYNFERQIIKSPFADNGCFGTTLSPLGDINLDGYKDIAIGAPFTAAGMNGAVAIFLGTANGLSLTPSQILYYTTTTAGTSTLSAAMFGHGLSKGVDIDQNGFNDLAVGAPEHDTVFIYKSYPVVKVNATIYAEPAEIPLNKNLNETQKLQIHICYNILTNSTQLKAIDLKLHINLDANKSNNQLKRLILDAVDSYQLEKNVTAGHRPSCEHFSATVKQQTQLLPIVMELEYSIQNDARLYSDNNDFCENCAVVDPRYPRVTRNTIKYKHDCNNIDCYVDLKIESVEMPNHFTLGASNNLTVNYKIENAGDNAFYAQIEVTTNLNLPIAIISSDCNIDMQSKLVCDLAKGTYFKGSLILAVSFDVSNIGNAMQLKIQALVSSSGSEQSPDDNIIANIIDIRQVMDIEITGQPNETFVQLENGNDVRLSKKYKIENHGPSPLAEFYLCVLIPIAYLPKHIDYSNITPFLNTTQTELYVAMDGYQYLPVSFNTFESSQLLLYPHENINDMKKYNLPEKHSLFVSCTNSENAVMCAKAIMKLPAFKPGQILTLELKYEIIVKAVEDIMLKKFKYFNIMPDVVIASSLLIKAELNTTFSDFEPIIIVNSIEQRTPLWIYLVSTLGGLLFLVLLTLALKKLGFFKRQTKEEMEKIIDVKMEVAKMNNEIQKFSDVEDA